MKKELTVLKALADETRLKIVEYLLDGEKCVCEIFPHLKRTQSTTSIQLDVLRRAGILDSRREGKKVFYFISDKKVCDMLKALGFSQSKLAKKLGVKLNKRQEVIIDNHSQTNVKGFFAAGDVTNTDWK